VMEWNAGGDS